MQSGESDRLAAWASALLTRHTGRYSRPEFLKAARALSARYVERRSALPGRSPLDSPARRAAFAVLHGPQHYLTVRAVIDGLSAGERPLDRIVDLGCGTGAASAAWALGFARPPAIEGIDRSGWALDEARWTWRTLGLRGRTVRGDLTARAAAVAGASARALVRTGLVAGWSLNELRAPSRDAVLRHLLAAGAAGGLVLVIEPLATDAVPWWPAWKGRFEQAGGRNDLWRIPNVLPDVLRRLDREAGFDRPLLLARSLSLGFAGDRHPRARIGL